ncbi:MAG: DUF389 domain-containing protein [Allomuricauda sp.]
MSEHLFTGGENTPGQESGDEVKKDFKGLLGSVRKFLSELLEIRSNTDSAATKESIIADIPFKGHTSWILVCSIFIASIGLNANSTAVVIGAMLISPLMGPILGMGLSLAINDIDTLRRSLKNFTVMVVLSVLTAYFFFAIFPLRDESSELLARTKPDIRDVLIAFFGGLALVIARAKKGTIASVIFGVAIATALMPPLCTVGFGLAIGKPWYAAGAMYLFIINTIFIGLATFLVIKFLRFPMVRYANSQRRRFIARAASIVGLAVMIPAGFTFYNALQESRFSADAQKFVNTELETLPNASYLKRNVHVEYNPDGDSKIELFAFGDQRIPEETIGMLNARLIDYSGLKNTAVTANYSGNRSLDELRYMQELRERDSLDLLNRTQQITYLQNRVRELTALEKMNIPFQEVVNEAKINYENLAGLSFAYKIQTDFNKTDTIPVFEVKWKENVSSSEGNKSLVKIQNWLKTRLKDSTLVVKATP